MEHSEKFELVKGYYDAGIWSKKAVKNAKDGKQILQELRQEAAAGDEDAKTILQLTGVKAK